MRLVHCLRYELLFLALGVLASASMEVVNANPRKSFQGIAQVRSEELLGTSDLDTRLVERAECGLGKKVCNNGCIPMLATCCETGGGYCDISEYCTSDDGCCPIGKTCSGTGSCSSDEVPCGPKGYCIPSDGNCCTSGTGYCPKVKSCIVRDGETFCSSDGTSYSYTFNLGSSSLATSTRSLTLDLTSLSSTIERATTTTARTIGFSSSFPSSSEEDSSSTTSSVFATESSEEASTSIIESTATTSESSVTTATEAAATTSQPGASTRVQVSGFVLLSWLAAMYLWA
ncbi:unnamed protein product [Clonostachys byssicola]|uniref:GPI anchored protein n=1 Tax=Clonostachys byssicola TaxID=160290 RepID=A0A9N9XZH7_9HYPO|nr:unnamed protein product [Clonostachys byssicola]